MIYNNHTHNKGTWLLEFRLVVTEVNDHENVFHLLRMGINAYCVRSLISRVSRLEPRGGIGKVNRSLSILDRAADIRAILGIDCFAN